MVLAVLGAALAAVVMAEYEFESYTPWAAGLAVGALIGEVIAGAGRWTSRRARVFAAAVAAGGVLWGEWLESDSGVERWSAMAWPAAALAAAVAAGTVRPRRSAAPG